MLNNLNFKDEILPLVQTFMIWLQ